MRIDLLSDRIIKGYRLKPAETTELIKVDFYKLMRGAEKIARHFRSDKAHLCSIVNAKSGSCPENCRFCAQSGRHKTKIDKYPLLGERELQAALDRAVGDGASCFGIVTSGRGISGRDLNRICSFVSGNRDKRIYISASLGEIGYKDLLKLKESGVKRYHHNIETAQSFFPKVCTSHSYSDRVKTVKYAKKAGLEVCCGGIIGLGESFAQRIELALALRALEVDSIPVNILNPVPGTPLENTKSLLPFEILRTIAVFRFILPDRNISVCGGRETNLGDFQSWIFKAGASGMMVGGYLTTPGRPVSEDHKMLKDLGLNIGSRVK